MLNDEERKWLRNLLNERFSPGQVVEVIDSTGHRYDSFVLSGLAPAATITEIVRQASEQGWDVKLVDQLILYINAHFEGQARTDVISELTTIRQNLSSQQGQVRALAHPFAACFVRNKLPFVNRPQLRQSLESLREPNGPRILLISGPPGAGKTYSAELPLAAVATGGEGGFKVSRLNMANETRKDFNARRFADWILLNWNPKATIPEQYQQISSYATELALWLLDQAPPSTTCWLIIDGIGKIVPGEGLIPFLQELARAIASTDRPVRLVLTEFGEEHPLPEEADLMSQPVSLQPLTSTDVIDYFFKLVYESKRPAGAPPFDPKAYEDKAAQALTQATVVVEGAPRLARLHQTLRAAATELGWV